MTKFALPSLSKVTSLKQNIDIEQSHIKQLAQQQGQQPMSAIPYYEQHASAVGKPSGFRL